MEIITKFENIPNLSLALGFFDGVHIAHQKLIKNAVNFAHENKTQSAVITLKQQPYCFLKHIAPKYISTRQDSYKIIEKLGIDYIIELDFDNISKMTSLEYLKDILIKYFSPIGIFTGFNHHFGLNREGDCDFLVKHAQEFRYKFFSLPSQKLNGTLISSSAIRKFLEKGKIENANAMLGREFCVDGIVIGGSKIGRTINFPTANIKYPNDIVEIPNGVYQTKIKLVDNRILTGISNFGSKPTVNNIPAKTFETHILNNFDENIYGQEITVKFLKFIRPERKFENLENLKKQIAKDIACID